MSGNALEVRDLAVAEGRPHGLGLAPVTISQAFRQALDGLMRTQRRKGTDISAATGLSSATITKLRNGERGASFEVLEKLRAYFDVEPSALFTPVWAGIDGRVPYDSRSADTSAPKRHTFVASNQPDQVLSTSPEIAEGGSELERHPDSELLSALLAYWDGMSAEARLELISHGRRLRRATAAPNSTFGRG